MLLSLLLRVLFLSLIVYNLGFASIMLSKILQQINYFSELETCVLLFFFDS